MSADEQALVERAKTDPEAFGILYERYVQKIYNYVYYRVGNHQDAEDLTARTFYRAMDHIGQFRQRGVPFSAWLYRIAHNLMANWHRDRQRHQVVALEDAALNLEQAVEPQQVAELDEEKEWLLASIRCLPAERQQLLVLKFAEGLSNAEIGQIMGRSEGAVKSLYYRTLVSLRELLEDPARFERN